MNEFDILLGANVYGGEEKCGRLVKVVVDPEVARLTHIVVEDGFLRKEARIVPFSALARTTTDRVELNVGRPELEHFEKYRLVNVEQTVSAGGGGGGLPLQTDAFGTPTATTHATKVREKVHEGISPILTVLNRNTPVNSVDGTFGSLQRLLVDQDTGQITRIVARRGTLRQSQPIVGAALIQDISEDRVFVNALKDDLGLLPEYQLGGERARGQTPEAPASAGVAAPEGEAELPLARRIEAALATNPQTSDAVVEVIEERGVVTLQGEVSDPQTRDAVQQVVTQVPGVLSVVNQLRFR